MVDDDQDIFDSLEKEASEFTKVCVSARSEGFTATDTRYLGC